MVSVLIFTDGFFECGVHKGIITPVACPRTAWDEPEFHKAPVHGGGTSFNAEVVADGGGDVDAGTLVGGVAGAGTTEDILPVIRVKRSAVFPLGKTVTTVVINLHPCAAADRFVLTALVTPIPGDDFGSFRLGTSLFNIVVGESDVEGVKLGRERLGCVGNRIPLGGIRVVIAAVVGIPLAVPAAGGVGYGVAGCCPMKTAISKTQGKSRVNCDTCSRFSSCDVKFEVTSSIDRVRVFVPSMACPVLRPDLHDNRC